ncbi:hypothetical protein TWF696_002420 [Orbilia brochopaga]|uniref:Uncharacterized protein n=1 Tax=Orbilia brochopaga TaxID=3140254 RepID=A0AAV9U852_9PEZI
MDPLDVTVIVPSGPMPWWITSPIAKWRLCIDIADIAATEPQDLAILDWKILFEIALRHPSSTWQLCPPVVLPNRLATPSSNSSCILPAIHSRNTTSNGHDTAFKNTIKPPTSSKKSKRPIDTMNTHIPILARIHHVDFVSSRAIFRLDSSTTTALLSHHTSYISHIQRSGRISVHQAVYVMQTFAQRLDALQVTLNAAVLTATDGVYARGDFPAFAKRQRSNQYVVRMLDLVLKESGLRKVIHDAFVDLGPDPHSIPVPQSYDVDHYMHWYGPSSFVGSESGYQRAASSSTEASAHLGSESSTESFVSPRELVFPYSELHAAICKNVASPPPPIMATATASIDKPPPTNKKKSQPRSAVSLEERKKRRSANIVENERGGKGRRPSSQYSQALPATDAIPSPRSSHKPSPVDTITASTASPVEMNPPKRKATKRAKRKLEEIPTKSSNLPSSTTPDTDSTLSTISSLTALSGICERGDADTPSKQPTNDENLAATKKDRDESTTITKPSPDRTLEDELKHDERTIYNMDSSFAPVTRRQAALQKSASAEPRRRSGSARRSSVVARPQKPRAPPRSSTPRNRNAPRTSLKRSADRDDDSSYNPSRNPSPAPKRRKLTATSHTSVPKSPKTANHEITTNDTPTTHKRTLRNRTNQMAIEPEIEIEPEIAAESEFEMSSDPEDLMVPPPPPPSPASMASPKHSRKRKRVSPEPVPEDYTDSEDCNLDSDTPDIELLCDSEDEADHRSRKLRRRARKAARREGRELTAWMLTTYPADKKTHESEAEEESPPETAATATDKPSGDPNTDDPTAQLQPPRRCLECGTVNCSWYDRSFM